MLAGSPRRRRDCRMEFCGIVRYSVSEEALFVEEAVPAF